MENNGQRKFCEVCGRRIIPGAKFCEGCGRRLPVSTSRTVGVSGRNIYPGNTYPDTNTNTNTGNTAPEYPKANSDTFPQNDIKTPSEAEQSTDETANPESNPDKHSFDRNKNSNQNDGESGQREDHSEQTGNYSEQLGNNSEPGKDKSPKKENNSERGKDKSEQQADNLSQKQTENGTTKRKKKPLKAILITLVAAAAVGCAGFFILPMLPILPQQEETFQLEDYVTYEFTGYDSMGEATISLDYDSLETDLEAVMDNKLERRLKKYSSDVTEWDENGTASDDLSEGELELLSYYSNGKNIAQPLVNLDPETETDLSNGDEITITFYYDADLLADYGVNFIGDDITVTVSDLPEATVVDVFQDVELSFHGASPNLSLDSEFYITPSGMDGEGVLVSCSPNSDLAIGDEVTLTIAEDMPEGYLAKEDSTTITIESAPVYIKTLSDIPDDLISTLRAEAQEFMRTKSSLSDTTQDNMVYQGVYFLTSKTTEEDAFNSKLYLIYKLTSPDPSSNITYYWQIEWDNPILNADGTGDVENISSPNYNDYMLIADGYLIYGGYVNWRYLYNEVIAPKLSAYNVETNIQ